MFNSSQEITDVFLCSDVVCMGKQSKHLDHWLITKINNHVQHHKYNIL